MSGRSPWNKNSIKTDICRHNRQFDLKLKCRFQTATPKCAIDCVAVRDSFQNACPRCPPSRAARPAGSRGTSARRRHAVLAFDDSPGLDAQGEQEVNHGVLVIHEKSLGRVIPSERRLAEFEVRRIETDYL